jgi:hypothetical protein
MRVFPHGHLSYAILPGIRLLPLVATAISYAGLAVSIVRSRSSESQRPAHVDALRAQQLTGRPRHGARQANRGARGRGAARGKSALVRAALVRPAVRRRASELRLC